MNKTRIRMLLIEDNPGDARLIRELLADAQGAAFDLIHADRLSEGLKFLAVDGIDVVVADLGLPDSQGVDTALKVIEQAPNVPVIILTGLDDETQAVKAVQHGAQDYLVKGQVDGASLARAIRYAIERKRAEEEIRQLNADLEQRVEARTRELQAAQEQLVQQERLAVLGQVAGSIGHELRNPLGVISNAVYFLKMTQPGASDKVIEYLNIIENETHTSVKLISELLDFTQTKFVEREPANLSDLVRQTLAHYPTPALVEVVLELPPDLPPVYANPQQIVQALGNLVVNACQAMPAGGRLTFSARQEDQMVAISIMDTGVGIPTENLKKLFEPLFTTKTKGIGLGLPVSRKLVEANGGRIEVQSEPGKGSTFTVYLPVAK